MNFPTLFETYEHAGMTIELHYDQDAESPRGFATNLGVMFCDHPDYDLGDEDAPDPREQTVDCPDCDGSDEGEYEVLDRRAYGRMVVTINDSHAPRFDSFEAAEAFVEQHQPNDQEWIIELRDCERCEGSGEIEVSIVEYLKREHGARVILPLFLMDHSGISMKAGGRLDTGEDDFRRTGRFMGDDAGWDTSSVGVIFDTAETRKACGCEDFSDEQIEQGLRQEVALYSTYIEGGAYGYVVKFPDGEKYDSCWGFYDDCGIEQAKEEAELGAAELAKRREACLVRGEDPHGTPHPDYDPNVQRFVIYAGRDEPDDPDPNWRYKLTVEDRKYQDSDGYPVHSIAGGATWEAAFQTACTYVTTAMTTNHCIF